MPKKETLLLQLQEKTRDQHFPLSGTFELTPRCTLDCKMCYVHLTEAQMGDRHELSTEEWLKLTDDACKAGMTFVMITGGECLLHPGFKDIYLKLKSFGVIISVNTNATLINDDYIDFFKKNPPAKIQISLYGSTEEGYERVTGRRCCEIVKRNILKLKEAGLNVKISVTVSKQLYDEAIDIVKFAKDNKINYVIDMDMIEAEKDTGRKYFDYSLTAEEVVRKYLELTEFLGKTPRKNKKLEAVPFINTDKGITKGFTCAAGHSIFTIKWDGTMQACINTIDSTINAVELGFQEAWNRMGEYAKNYPLPIECSKCKLASACCSCVVRRADPNDPSHCNPERCKVTLAMYNAGVAYTNCEI